MTPTELLAQLRAAAGRTLSFQAEALLASWASGDGSAVLHAAADATALPTFTLRAYNGGLLNIGWGYPVVVDLAGMQISKKPRPILKDHKPGSVVGHSTEVTNNLKNLIIAGLVSGTGPDALEVVANAKNGFPWQASIGCSVLKAQFIDDKQTAEANGKTWKGPIYYVSACVLNEISIVALGGDDTTSAQIAASLTQNPVKESSMDPVFATWLAAKGFVAASLTPDQTTSLQAAWQAEVAAAAKPTPATPPAPADETAVITRIRAAAAAETDRLAAIHAAAAGDAKLEAQAIREGWSAEKTELHALRASRPTPPVGGSGGTSAPGVEVIEAALSMSCGIRPDDLLKRGVTAQTIDAAHKNLRNVSLSEVILLMAAQAGHQARPGDLRSDGGLRNALRAAFSQVALPGILSAVANKYIADSYSAVEQAWRQIASIVPAKDFKTSTRYRLTGNLKFELVAPSGEIKHGTLGEQPYTNKVDTHAKLLQISRQDIINDDLGALTGVPKALGRGAGLQLNEVFWKEFLNNAAFFVAGNNNISTGIFGNAGVTAADLVFRNQVDANGFPLGITPKILLVPNALSFAADQLLSSTLLTNGAATAAGNANPLAGKYKPVTSSYLSNAAMGGQQSAAAYYLLADPADLAVIEVAFLNGQDSPTIETAEADFENLGIQMRGFFDFGVAKQEPRSGVRSTGA